MSKMTAAEEAEKPIYDSLNDIIKALDAMYNSKKFIRKADYWARCAGEAASILRRVASGELAPVTHSHWNRINRMATGLQDEFRCNACGWPVKDATKCCPNCRAIMDEPAVSQTLDGKDDEDAEIH
jgi:rubrerythrin